MNTLSRRGRLVVVASVTLIAAWVLVFTFFGKKFPQVPTHAESPLLGPSSEAKLTLASTPARAIPEPLVAELTQAAKPVRDTKALSDNSGRTSASASENAPSEVVVSESTKPSPSSELEATRRMYAAHAPLRVAEVANPDSETNRIILQSMIQKALVRAQADSVSITNP